MYKDIEKEDTEKTGEGKNEKVIIRVKRKVDEMIIPSIYVKRSNKRVCNGIFYKHFDTAIPEVDIEKENIECVNLLRKHEQCHNSSSDLSSLIEKKRKFNSLKGYEKDLKEAINNLKRYRIVNENIQYVNLDAQKKEIYKIIDVNLLQECGYANVGADAGANTGGAQKDETKWECARRQTEKDAHNKAEQEYEYDLYIVDDQKIEVNDYMDYMYHIKNNNVDSAEVIVLEDVYGNNTNEYDSKSFSSSSSDHDTVKEMSDYPDESSSNGDGSSGVCSVDGSSDSPVRSGSYDRSVANDHHHGNNIHNDCYGGSLASDYHLENNLHVASSQENSFPSDFYDENYVDQLSNCSEDNLFGEDLKNIGHEDNLFGSRRCAMNNWESSIKVESPQGGYNNHSGYLDQRGVSHHNAISSSALSRFFPQKSTPKKNERKIHTHNKKMNSLMFEEEIKDELEKRLKKKNENMLNVTLSEKLKILEQMENEYYDK
ncbi:conserved Plasmodium protein, unknown function [Plasmodium knowlesi strain H]|uniref:Uncharacterized protein n=3 Tax=Plasmodium knowlesi TaxID=5850 RepID=A0A5K1VP32_PLAKH|nr:conserved Plasmodium protein, unknown function [Plasmodium knowlesi strain H]OTN63680.1 Uncharacterized protein PKNOH_S140255400 [Plasmodium knowlesi]CAA9990969.1 conserved Plasmodium protein, unknown function [Plasmodium knowlesi strain H]SBO20791.1 conserved Plasmodium protein, unknown function [Plasmodium knowlesi strain H]SBO21230.1 conserved Plasmodium protein, unknown function [Plasmodium knowlesi strain H]VVS80443.1 conserved Plasmodium protein, unknown function [Plasmodium knowlesi |eukprot:XP_002262252.1 hypothetical protein, conserved in Plasmodium species [Plasmodium knowlesi strain H]